jgi:hypothetical protein
LVLLEIEPRASSMQGKCFTTWAIPSADFLYKMVCKLHYDILYRYTTYFNHIYPISLSVDF